MSTPFVCIAALSVFAFFVPATPALPAPSAGPANAPNSATKTPEAEAQALEAELKTLNAQTPRNDARIRAIDARLAAITEQRARTASENGNVATKTTITNAELEASNAQNTYEAIKNVPGVTQADSSAAGTSDNLQIRGIKLASNTGYRLDGGLPIVNNIILSTEDKAQVQVLKGAGALEYGLASPAGIINYVLKRAGKLPVNAVSLSSNGYGQAIANADFARKFGFADRIGVRVNAGGGSTGSFTAGAGGTRFIGSLAADYSTKKARVRLDLEQYGVNVVEQAALLLNKADKRGSIALPRLPDPRKLLSGDWDRSVGVGGNLALHTDYNFNDSLSLSAEAGESTSRRGHRGVAQISAINLTTGIGTETVSLVRDQTQFNHYANVETHIKSKSRDFVSNELTIGATRNSRDSNNPVTGKAAYKQNIYDPIELPVPVFPDGPIAYQPQTSVDYDYFFHDSALFFERLHLVGGLRQINYRADAREVGTKPTHTRLAFLAPAIGAIVDFNSSFSAYASYVKSLEESPLAPINSKNSLALLAPEPSTQREVGIRATVPRTYSATLAYFFIERANATIDPVTEIFGLNGTNTFAGLESTVGVPIGSSWGVSVGGQYMHARQHSPDDLTIDGKIPENTPRLSGNVGLTYRPSSIHGLTLSASASSIASREINPQDQGTIPGVTTYGLGASYVGVANHNPMVVNLSVRNLTNRTYYSSVVSNVLGVAAPRTVSISIRMTP